VRDYEVIATAGNRTLTDRDPTGMPKYWRSGKRPKPSAPNGWSIAILCDAVSRVRCARLRFRFARISGCITAPADPKGGAVESGVRFFTSPTCHHVPEVYPR